MKYSAVDIDRMRRAVDWMSWHKGMSTLENALLIERRLCTYMMNETAPEELERQAAEIRAIRQKEQIEMMRAMQNAQHQEDPS